MHSIHRAAAFLVAACLLPLLTACASDGDNVGNTTKTAGTITFRDYTQSTTMSLVSDSQLLRDGVEGKDFEERTLSFYSTSQPDAAAKACHDDAIAGLVQAFEESGLAQSATAGPAPATGRAKDQSFEIVIDGQAKHVLKSSSNNLAAFVEFTTGFVQVYNLYEGRANVDGAVEFERPTFGGNLGGNR